MKIKQTETEISGGQHDRYRTKKRRSKRCSIGWQNKWSGKSRKGGKMGTIIVGLFVAGVAALAVRSMVRDKKKGRSLQCGTDCSRCGGCCH